MDLLSIESLAFRQIKNTVYSWKVKMTGSNNETEEKGKIILSRETNILLIVNQSEAWKWESGIAAETVYVGRILCLCFFALESLLYFKLSET